MRNFNEAKAQAQAIITAARKLQKTRNTAGQLDSRKAETISKMEALAKKLDKLPETTMSGMNELDKSVYSADCIAEDIVELENSKDKMRASLLANWQLKAEEEKYIANGSEIIGKLPTLEDVLTNGCSDTIKPSTDDNTETDTAQNNRNTGTPSERSNSEAFNKVMNLIEQLGENKPAPIHTLSVPTDQMGSEEADSIEDTNVEITTGDIITEIGHIGHNITINIGGNVNITTAED